MVELLVGNWSYDSRSNNSDCGFQFNLLTISEYVQVSKVTRCSVRDF